MNKLVLVVAILSIYIFTQCKNETKSKAATTEKKVGQFAKEKTTAAAVVHFSSETVRPSNMAITSNGRMFETLNPLLAPDSKIYETVKLADDVVLATSFLQDFIIDEKHNRLIIADMTQGDLKSPPTPAFIVVDMKKRHC